MSTYRIRYPDELYHYGVKGMKWGVRHDSEKTRNIRSRDRMPTAKKVAIGVGVAAAVAGVSYLALTKTDTGRLVTHLGKSSVQRITKTSKAIYRSNKSNPGRNKANFLPKTMREYEKISRRQAKKFAKESAQGIYKKELSLARRRNYMYTLDGKPNFTKKTMRELEARSKSAAKNAAAEKYAYYYDKELARARRMNYMYHH